MRLFLVTLSLTVPVGWCEQSAAQIIPRVNLISTFTDNLFQSNNRQSAWINHAYVDLDYSSNSDLNVYYTGNANVFSDQQDLFNHSHSAGLSWLRAEP